jgi:hypothetical protein
MLPIALASFIVMATVGAVVAARAALRLRRRIPRVVALVAAADALATRAAEVEQSSARIHARVDRVRSFGEAIL